jgi:hypothetical protein
MKERTMFTVIQFILTEELYNLTFLYSKPLIDV